MLMSVDIYHQASAEGRETSLESMRLCSCRLQACRFQQYAYKCPYINVLLDDSKAGLSKVNMGMVCHTWLAYLPHMHADLGHQGAAE